MSYSLYVHIPFCRRRCNYCDFYTEGGQNGVPEQYIAALLRDFSLFAPKGDDGKPLSPATLYFGGGTPSLLEPQQLERLIKEFAPQESAEITLEANPEELSLALLQGYRKAGVNRISLGVQTADDKSLKSLGRLHTKEDSARAFELCKKAGFKNISGDIMLALSEYSTAEFDKTLQLIENGGATHVSAYLLKIEAGTPFAKTSFKSLPNSDEAADFYLYAVQKLAENGYKQYEISNFAKQGFEGKHNLVYWDCGEYLGIGAAAHSCLANQRFSFAAHTKNYMQSGAEKISEGSCTAEDFIMLQLRLNTGLDERQLEARFGTKLSAKQQKTLESIAQHGLAERLDGRWSLTPQGMLLQNNILTQLFADG